MRAALIWDDEQLMMHAMVKRHFHRAIVLFSPMPACAYCGDAGATWVCARCGTTAYCNADHQRAHWSQHKKQCVADVIEVAR